MPRLTDEPPAEVAVELATHRNNQGCTMAGARPTVGFDGWGRTFPAEEVAVLAGTLPGFAVAWGGPDPDNVSCDGQTIELTRPAHAGQTLFVVGASTGGSLRDRLVLSSTDGAASTEVHFGLTDFLAVRPAFDEVCVLACGTLRDNGRDVPGPRPRLWRLAVPLSGSGHWSRMRLPVNPDIHVFALWLASAPAEWDGGRS